jgi:2-methylaconitate cis-trans-isomerase PrpF
VPGVGVLKATMINAGIPTIFVNAEAIGYKALNFRTHQQRSEGAGDVRDDPRARRLRMGLIKEVVGSGQAPAHAEGRVRG